MYYRPKELIMCLVDEVIEFTPADVLVAVDERTAERDETEVTHLKVCRSLADRAVWVPVSMLTKAI